MLGGAPPSGYSSEEEAFASAMRQCAQQQGLPRQNTLQLTGTMHPVTVVLNMGYVKKYGVGTVQVKIGCQDHSLDYWQQHSPALARHYKYTEQQRLEYCAYLDGIRVMIESLLKIKPPAQTLHEKVADVLEYMRSNSEITPQRRYQADDILKQLKAEMSELGDR